jgi:outer membrane immunogenic protein
MILTITIRRTTRPYGESREIVDRCLFYVKGGAAWTNEKVDDALTDFRGIAVDPSTSNARTGCTIGTGTEWGLSHETGRQRSSMITMTSAARGFTLIEDNAIVNEIVTVHSFKDTIHAVTVGVNYRF